MNSHGNHKALTSYSQKPLILLMVMFVFTLTDPGIFLTLGSFKSILLAIPIYGVVVCDTIYPILLEGIGLAARATAAMSGACVMLTIIKVDYSFTGVMLGILFGPTAGVMAGIAHGTIISNFNVPLFLITLANQNIIYGITQSLTGNQVISCLEPVTFTFLGGGRPFGIPFSVCILVIVASISFWMLSRTAFGRQVYAAGGNKEASDLSGVSSEQAITALHAISSFTVALVGIVLASMNQQVIVEAAQGHENDVLIIIVVGGTNLMGGEGSLQGAVFRALLAGMINNGLRLLEVPSTYHNVIKGIIIIAAITADAHGQYKNNGLKRSGILIGIFNCKEESVKPI